MITLKVEPYCQDCSEFEPNAYSESYYGGPDSVYTNTTVQCVNCNKCKHIAEHIKRAKEGK